MKCYISRIREIFLTKTFPAIRYALVVDSIFSLVYFLSVVNNWTYSILTPHFNASLFVCLSLTASTVTLLCCSLSMSGHRIPSTPGTSVMYCASKHALTAINEGIRRELREMKSNVKITVSISMICIHLSLASGRSW